MNYYIEIYEDLGNAWRWRLVASNGRIVADSAEAYVNKFNARRSAKRLVELGLQASIVEK